MRSKHLIFLAAFVFCFASSSAFADSIIGTYEISYIYNSMSDGTMPVGSLSYNGQWSSPIKVALKPGNYYTAFTSGRITGNDFYDYGYLNEYNAFVPVLNPGSIYPATGFNGGNTNPVHNDPSNGWWYMMAGWVGTSEISGDVFWGGNFKVNSGESLWLYWTDPYILDNLGGVTVEIWQTGSSEPVPEPASLILVGVGLGTLMLGAWRKRK